MNESRSVKPANPFMMQALKTKRQSFLMEQMSRTGAFPHKGSMVLKGELINRSEMLAKRSDSVKFDGESTRNTHTVHRTEEIYTDEERPFLKDPGWRRNDYSPNFLNYLERKATPTVRFNEHLTLLGQSAENAGEVDRGYLQSFRTAQEARTSKAVLGPLWR